MNDSSKDAPSQPQKPPVKGSRLRGATRFGGRAAASIGDQASTAATSFATSLFVGRVLGPEILGIYAMTDVVVRLLRALSLSALLEPMSIYAPRRAGDELGAYLCFLVVAELVLVGGLTMLLALGSVVWEAMGDINTTALWALVAALFYCNVILMQSLIRRQFYIENQPLKALIQSLGNLALVILGFAGFWYFGGANLVSIYIMLSVAGAVVCTVQAFRLFHRFRRPSTAQRRAFIRETWGYARWNVVSNAIAQVSISGVILLAGVMLPIEAAGYLKVNETLIAPFLQIVVGLNLLMLPMVSKRIDQMTHAHRRRDLGRFTIATLVVAIPYSAVMVLFGDWMVRVGFGADLMPATSLLLIYASIPIFDALNNPPTIFLSAEGRSDLKIIPNCIRAVLTLAAGIPLIWSFDVTGAAWARALSAFAGTAASWACIFWLWRRQAALKAAAD